MNLLSSSILLISFLIHATPAHAYEWDEVNNPANINPHYVYRLDQLPKQGRLDDAHMPWSDNYWESDWGGISLRWQDLDEDQLDPEVKEYVDKYALFAYTPPSKEEVLHMSTDQIKVLSPAEKYDILMSRYDYPTVYSERQRTGPREEDWQGLCHGWVVAAVNYAEPKPVEMTNAEGVKIPFGSSDIKGLLSYYYGVTVYDYARGDRHVVKKADQVQYLDQIDALDIAKWVKLASGAVIFDQSGFSVDLDALDETGIDATIPELNHVYQVGPRAGETNAGAFHVVMANQLGLLNRGFASNINTKVRTSQIWNQPVMGYSSEITSDLTSSHPHAHRGNWVDVTTTLNYVSEIAQTYDPVVNTAKQRLSEITFNYSLELDDAGNIIGGEWQRGFHPSFVWVHDKIDIRGYFSKLNQAYQARFH